MDTNETTDGTDFSNRPAFSHRHGRLTLTVWANETEHGTRYSSEITRTWKDGEEFRTTTRLDERDLPAAARLAATADDWVNAAKQAARKADNS